MKTDDLLRAIQDENYDEVQKLVATSIGDNPTLLHSAVETGNAEIVKALLKAGANKWIDEFDDWSFTPLMWAAKNNNLLLVKLLIEAGSDVNAHNESKIGNTALREVVETCDFEIVDTLIKAGADPKIPGWMQLTALDKALERLEASNTPANQKIVESLKAVS